MNRIDLRKTGKLTAFQINIHKKEMSGWCAAIFGISFLYTILFPSVKDMAQMKMDAMPEELLQFIGMNGLSDMGNYISYLATIFGMILICISVFAISFSSHILLDEEKEGSVEFLYSNALSKTEIYAAKFLTVFLAVFAVICAAAVASLISGVAGGGDTFDFAAYSRMMKLSTLTPFFFAALSFALAGASRRLGGVMVGITVLMVSYVLGYLSKLLGENWEWLKYLSPFEALSCSHTADPAGETLVYWGVVVAVGLLLVLAGAILYNRRDYEL